MPVLYAVHDRQACAHGDKRDDDQWTRFEDFPSFLKDVEEVRQVDNTHLHWRARIAGQPVEWDSEITTRIPDRRISWRSTSGPPSSGAVSFDRVADHRTRITLRMSYRAPGFASKVGDALGAVRMELSGNLHRFADFIQSRRRETGAGRGTVTGGSTSGDEVARQRAQDMRDGLERATASGPRDTRTRA